MAVFTKRSILIFTSLIVLFVVMGMMVWRMVYVPQRAMERILLAEELLARGSYDSAYDYASYAVRYLPEEAMANFIFAEALAQGRRDSTQANHYFRRAWELSGDDYRITLRYGVFSRESRDGELSERLLEGLSQRFPDSSQVFYQLGLTCAHLGDLDAAYAHYSQSIALDAGNEAALLARGDHLAHIQDFEAAIADWDRIITGGGDAKGRLRARRGVFKVKIMDFAGGIRDLLQAQALGVDNVRLRLSLGEAYINLGQLDSAFLFIDQGLRLFPQNDSLLELRALASIREGKPESAIRDLQNMLRGKYLGSARAYYLLGIAFTQGAKYQDAIAAYTQAIEVDRNKTEAYFNRGLAFAYDEQFDEAVRDYDTVLIREPRNVLAVYARGVALINLDRFEAGCRDLEQAARMGSKEAQALLPRYCARE